MPPLVSQLTEAGLAIWTGVSTGASTGVEISSTKVWPDQPHWRGELSMMGAPVATQSSKFWGISETRLQPERTKTREARGRNLVMLFLNFLNKGMMTDFWRGGKFLVF